MKGPYPATFESLYAAMVPVVYGWRDTLESTAGEPSLYTWQALSYQFKAMAARIDHLVDKEKEERRERRTRNQDPAS